MNVVDTLRAIAARIEAGEPEGDVGYVVVGLLYLQSAGADFDMIEAGPLADSDRLTSNLACAGFRHHMLTKMGARKL